MSPLNVMLLPVAYTAVRHSQSDGTRAGNDFSTSSDKIGLEFLTMLACKLHAPAGPLNLESHLIRVQAITDAPRRPTGNSCWNVAPREEIVMLTSRMLSLATKDLEDRTSGTDATIPRGHRRGGQLQCR